MFKSNNKNNKYFFILIISLGIAGIVFFFPMRIEDGYTCLFHFKFAHNSPVEKVFFNGTNGEGESQAVSGMFIKEYIHNWAFLWWLSIIFVGIGSYEYLKKRKSKNDLELK